jgi:type VI secretion system protein ImpF
MARQLIPADRLQPALLDRLTGDGADARVMSKTQLRQAVLRDLTWLFNVTRPRAADLARAPLARRSVHNFGLPALAGQTASSLEVFDLERAIRQAIIDFEPRILARSLQVKAVTELGALDHHNVIGVEIRGELWAQPVPLELVLRTELDLETGKVQISDLGSGRIG